MDTLNITNGDIVLELIYLLSALFFVWGLKLLSSPDSARRGNMWAGTGMLLAMVATLVLHRDGEGNAIKGANIAIILGAIAFGGVIGGVIARRIKMTAMPQLVSFLNATGGAASALVATAGSLFIQITVESESMRGLLVILSLVSMFGFVISFAVTFISTSVLSLLIIKAFLDNGLGSKEPELFPTAGERQFSYTLNPRVLVWGLIAGFVVALVVVNGLIKNLEFEDRTEIMAHRGASLAAPENTMAAVRSAIDSGAQWVEIDVQETADGEVVVIHDSDLQKIGRVPLGVATSELEELQEVDIGSWFGEEFSEERIPTLDQVLRLCKDRIRVNIELKYYGAQQQLEKRVAEIVDANAMADQVVVMSLSLDGIRKMRQLRPAWTLGLLSSVAVGNLAALDVDFLALNARFASRHLIRRMHEQGKDIMVWTINDPVGMSAMASRGVDVIITDEPALAVSLMEQREQLEPAERLLMQLADIFQKPSLYREQ